MRIKKEFEFSAAHRLTFHDGACANLHGHNWVGYVEIDTQAFDNLVMDFGDIKKLIMNRYDHVLLMYNGDKILNSICDYTETIFFDKETTVENIAVDICEEVLKRLGDEFNGDITVKLYETKNNSAKHTVSEVW